jgi:hypothetical protein
VMQCLWVSGAWCLEVWRRLQLVLEVAVSFMAALHVKYFCHNRGDVAPSSFSSDRICWLLGFGTKLGVEYRIFSNLIHTQVLAIS